MKKTILSIATCLTLGGFANAQNVNIPDVIFKNALVGNSAINTNGDSEIQTGEASAFSGTISITSLGISDLTGIEAFTNITKLDCSGNSFTSLDISQNTALTHLWCNTCSLSSLDISNNTALRVLHCSGNSFSTLDVSNNTALTEFHCFNSSLTSLDVSQNPVLREVRCEHNSLTILNVANGNNGVHSTQLHRVKAHGNSGLTCIQHDAGFNPTTANNWTKNATASWSDNCNYSCVNTVNIPDANFKNALLAQGSTITGVGISTIDTDGDGEICVSEAQAYTGKINVNNQNISDLTGIEAFTNLTRLDCSYNTISSLDISQNTALRQLYCTHNQLTSLNVANGNNGSSYPSLILVRATHNNLACIQHDTGFDPTTNTNWKKDAGTSWSDNCSSSGGGTSSINENTISFSIVPNPTNGMVKIETEAKISSVEIFSLSGQRVASFSEPTFSIEMLKNGVYFVKVLSNNSVAVKRIVKE